MTIAIDRPIQPQPLSFDEFLDRYGGDNRYELIDGEYEIQQLRGDRAIVSPTFSDLKLTAEQVLKAGR